jgi:hypothetical protein
VNGNKAPYRLTFTEGVWVKQALDGYDPNADLVLLGKDPGEQVLAGKAGTVSVLRLPMADGDLKVNAAAVREDYLKKQKQAGYPDTRIEVPEDRNRPGEGPADIGSARGYLARLHVKNTDSRELYAELATVLVPGGVLVIECECLWSRREYWQQEFALLRDTLRLEKPR